jgi:hypothetical protein
VYAGHLATRAATPEPMRRSPGPIAESSTLVFNVAEPMVILARFFEQR